MFFRNLRIKDFSESVGLIMNNVVKINTRRRNILNIIIELKDNCFL